MDVPFGTWRETNLKLSIAIGALNRIAANWRDSLETDEGMEVHILDYSNDTFDASIGGEIIGRHDVAHIAMKALKEMDNIKV